MGIFYHPLEEGCYNRFMIERALDHLPRESVLALFAKIAPGSRLQKIKLLPGSFSNHTHLVEASQPDGGMLKCVVRRYQVFGDYDRGEKARREFRTYELLNRHSLPSPEPLYLDDRGELLGVPGIVTRFVPGHLVLGPPADPLDWARKMARTLARIHAIPCSPDTRQFLLNGNAEASWFLKADQPPAYMQSYPGGADLWQALRDRHPGLRPVPPVLLHIDYWPGNILWHAGEISAVIDWEEASYGDLAVDVAYALMHLLLEGVPAAVEAFLDAYETKTGGRVENLSFWELAAAVRPMVDPEDWEVVQPPKLDRLQHFIAEAKRAE